MTTVHDLFDFYIPTLALLSGLFFSLGSISTTRKRLEEMGTNLFKGNEIAAMDLALQRVDFIFGVLLLVVVFFLQLIENNIDCLDDFFQLEINEYRVYIVCSSIIILFAYYCTWFKLKVITKVTFQTYFDNKN